MKIKLKKGSSVKRCKVGFSWTIFLLGGLPLLFRGMYGHFLIVLFTIGFANWYYMFTGNRIYVEQLLGKGYEPADGYSKNVIKSYFD